MKRKRTKTPSNDYCSLEDRKLLAVGAHLVDGNLVVRGAADGPVHIQAVEQGTFEVTDNGVSVGTVEDVTRGIRVRVNNSDGPEGDRVHIDLGGFDVGGIAANLGRGNNGLSVDNGHVRHDVIYRGFAGDDHVNFGEDTRVGGSIFMRLGNGDNSVDIDAHVRGGVGIGAGSGADTIQYGDTADIGRTAFSRLGGGENSVEHAGRIGGNLGVIGGNDADHVEILNEAIVDHGAFFYLGHGDNTVDHWGTVNGGFWAMGRTGNDTFELHEDSHIQRRTRLFMGGGENSANVQGTINSHLAIISTNPDDSVEVNEDLVAGRVYINLDWGGGGDDDGDE